MLYGMPQKGYRFSVPSLMLVDNIFVILSLNGKTKYMGSILTEKDVNLGDILIS
jgi:hypothetical protein